MDTAQTAGSIALISRLWKLIHRRTTEAVLGMRPRQFSIMHYLREHNGISQQALGEMVFVDPNNLILLLNELEAAGSIERVRDPRDRRRHIVRLTPDGLQALERAEIAQEGIEDEVLAALSREERATLRRLLSKALNDATGGP